MESIFKRTIVVVLIFVSAAVLAQEKRLPFFAEKGGIIGGGYGVNAQSLPEGKYIPVFFIAHFAKDIIDPARLTRRQRFMVFFEPQVNAVILKNNGDSGRAAEFGLNVGVQYLYPLSRNVFFYTLISTGPHFIAVHTERQAHGFIFSDNMGAGAYFFVSRNVALNIGMRIRHMSNANLRMPNHGINTMNGFLGISYILQ